MARYMLLFPLFTNGVKLLMIQSENSGTATLRMGN